MTDNRQRPTIHIVSFKGYSAPGREASRMLVECVLSDDLPAETPTRLSFDGYGRPFLDGVNDLSISYAHSPTSLVIALQHSVNSSGIGVDTEPTSRLSDLVDMKDYAFSSAEKVLLTNDNQLVNAWCLKEAAVKRLGTGFRNFNPTELTILSNGKSYKLYSGNKKIHEGFFNDINLDGEIIVLCADGPIRDLSLYNHDLKDFREEQRYDGTKIYTRL